jgi:hypothetical protein
MDIKIIINSFIILFILHIIILNIDYNIVFGKKKDFGKKNNIEKFTDSKSNDNSMDFLTNNNNNNDEFKQKLLKYMQKNEIVKETEFENKNINKINPSNSYLSDNNDPNFESNVADISKFYKFNYDNLDEDQLKSTSIEKINKDNKIKEDINIDVQSKEPYNVKNYGRESTVNPDSWVYKDELPMNGGQMNGIIGFDSLESQFAIYNPNKLNLQSSSQDTFNNIPHDDLRKPIIYEN